MPPSTVPGPDRAKTDGNGPTDLPARGGVLPPAGRSRPPWLYWAAAFYGVLAGAGLLWNAQAGRSWVFLDAEAARRGVWWFRDLALGAGAAAAVVALSNRVTRRTRWGAELARALGELLGPLSVAQCLSLAALSGLAEEIFFRGALQPRVGWAAASVLFGLAHFAPRRDLRPWAVFAIGAGGLLGALYEATGNLVAPVVAHAGINAVNLHLLATRYGRRAVDGPGEPPAG